MIEEAQEYLQKYFGYETFRDGQKEIISKVLSGKNTAGIMPTGGGKSICYQIPALVLNGLTIVISPLISLMKDQVDSLLLNGIEATFLNSSISAKEASDRLSGIADGLYKLVYIAPERLELPSFLQELQRFNISMVAIDEAHCISQWGHDFRPSYLKIKTLIKQLPSNPVVLALTATATPAVRNDICQSLDIEESNTVFTGFERSNLSFAVVKDENRNQYLKRYLSKNQHESGIIYASTRKEVDQLYTRLAKGGVKAGRYHAGMNEQERSEQQEQFLQDDISLMVATSAFGMGIDKSNVRFVVHYGTPKNMESYYQEAGRAGRDGLDSECILLYSPQDLRLQRFLIDQSESRPEWKDLELKKLNAMKDYCFTEGCLQAFILRYFGEENPENCGHCENCKDSRNSVDVTTEAQMVLSCMIRMGERFGKTLISQVLTGSKNKKVEDFNFQKLSTYGIMKKKSAKEVADFIDYLTSKQFIEMTGGQFPVLKVTDQGKEVLLGKQMVMRKELSVITTISADNLLFEELRQLRKEIAQEEKVPPFVIFSDASLKDMSASFPVTPETFITVKGVGQKKQEKYGQIFIRKIQEYLAENPGLSAPAEEIIKKRETKGEPSHLETFRLFKEGKSIEEIAVLRGLAEISVENHLLKCGEEGRDVDWQRILPESANMQILDMVSVIGAEKLKPLKEALPEEISYFMIKAALLRNSVEI
ncbi:DNA helicase RecQ [Bacillus sp. MUM 13]|uniref:DNA helicase RecQ n=1 Tax=Bacillus sp. MUM 13 TaxID=1678001 RepID=UPI0008F571BD|nr:DNA helicase RecQ [Bacillus sp. MUM 13]OIK09003.1 ATP-dependent DNA helicase RecQ [Bacillus sp. MUM 13]